MAQHLDDFSTDPAARWTTDFGQPWTWDSVNEELDLDVADDMLHRYTNASPGSLEHEAQVTTVMPGAGDRMVGPSVRANNAAADDMYGLYNNDAGDIFLDRWIAGARSTLHVFDAAITRTVGNFYTIRLAASGGNGANVVLDIWITDHGSSKPSDPGWIGASESPDLTFTDTDASRLDDSSVNLQCGIGGRGSLNVEYDTRHDYYKQRAISDRQTGTRFLLSRF